VCTTSNDAGDAALAVDPAKRVSISNPEADRPPAMPSNKRRRPAIAFRVVSSLIASRSRAKVTTHIDRGASKSLSPQRTTNRHQQTLQIAGRLSR